MWSLRNSATLRTAVNCWELQTLWLARSRYLKIVTFSSHLCKKVCPSVGLSVCRSISPSKIHYVTIAKLVEKSSVSDACVASMQKGKFVHLLVYLSIGLSNVPLSISNHVLKIAKSLAKLSKINGKSIVQFRGIKYTIKRKNFLKAVSLFAWTNLSIYSR